MATPALRRVLNAAPFRPQRSRLTAARARPAAAEKSSGTASGLPSLANSARRAFSCGLCSADLSRKGTRIAAGSARKSCTTRIRRSPPISSAGAIRAERAASALIQAEVCSSDHVCGGASACRGSAARAMRSTIPAKVASTSARGASPVPVAAPDAAPPDAAPDAAPPEAGPLDAGPPDAGSPDVAPDAAPPDAASPDAAPPEAACLAARGTSAVKWPSSQKTKRSG